jgi:hypothetical protein
VLWLEISSGVDVARQAAFRPPPDGFPSAPKSLKPCRIQRVESNSPSRIGVSYRLYRWPYFKSSGETPVAVTLSRNAALSVGSGWKDVVDGGSALLDAHPVLDDVISTRSGFFDGEALSRCVLSSLLGEHSPGRIVWRSLRRS